MYQQIVDQITAKVMAGDWAAGQPLPSIRELAAASQVSVITVRRAYEELERAGVIATRQGKGSVVAERGDLPTVLMRESLQQHLDALLAAAARLGMSRDELLSLIEQALDPHASAAPEPGPGEIRAISPDTVAADDSVSASASRAARSEAKPAHSDTCAPPQPVDVATSHTGASAASADRSEAKPAHSEANAAPQSDDALTSAAGSTSTSPRTSTP